MQNAIPSEMALFTATQDVSALKGGATHKGQDSSDAWAKAFAALAPSKEIATEDKEDKQAQPPMPEANEAAVPEVALPDAASIPTSETTTPESVNPEQPFLSLKEENRLESKLAQAAPVQAYAVSSADAPEKNASNMDRGEAPTIITPSSVIGKNDTLNARDVSKVFNAESSALPFPPLQAGALPPAAANTVTPIDGSIRPNTKVVLTPTSVAQAHPKLPTVETVTALKPEAERLPQTESQPAARPGIAAGPTSTPGAIPATKQQTDTLQNSTAMQISAQSNMEASAKESAMATQRKEVVAQSLLAAPVMAKAITEQMAPSAAISISSALKLQTGEADKAPPRQTRVQTEAPIPLTTITAPSPAQTPTTAMFSTETRITAVDAATMAPVSDVAVETLIGSSESRTGAPTFHTGGPTIQTTAIPSTLVTQSMAPQIAAQIAQVSRPLPDGPVELTLKPEELGRLKLSFLGTEAGTVVTITAERPETLELMRRNIDMLAQEMRRLGHEAAQFNFTGGDTARGGKRDNAPTPDATRIVLDGDTFSQISPLESHQTMRLGADGLDLRL